MTSLLMTFINILIVAIWKSRKAFRACGWGNMPLQAVKLPISHTNVVGENTVLQLNILETGVLTLVVQNSSPTLLRLVGDELWTTRVRTPISKMFRWITYNSSETEQPGPSKRLKRSNEDREPERVQEAHKVDARASVCVTWLRFWCWSNKQRKEG